MGMRCEKARLTSNVRMIHNRAAQLGPSMQAWLES